MEPSQSTRLNPKQTDAIERRKRMTQRRQGLTQKIRKHKKSAYLAQKRQLQLSSDDTVGDSVSSSSRSSINRTSHNDVAEFRTLFGAIISAAAAAASPDPDPDMKLLLGQQLQTLQMGLTTVRSARNNETMIESDGENHPLVVLTNSVDDEQLAARFLQILLHVFMTDASDDNNNNNKILKTTILRILVDLSSFSRTNDNNTSSSYYGPVALTWSELIVISPHQGRALASGIPTPVTPLSPPSPSASTSWLQRLCRILSNEVVSCNGTNHANDGVSYMCCLIIGNVVGEGPTVIHHLSQSLKIEMVRTLIAAIRISSTHLQFPQHQPRPQQLQQQHFSVAPGAAWSLTNLIRNDLSSFANTYVNDQLLSTSILQSWLCQYPSIATQAAWMIASLTSKEEESARYLATGLVPSLLQCLYQPVVPDQQLPILQALGNFASHSSFVPGLLQSTTAPSTETSTTISAAPIDLVTILQQMLTDLSAGDPRLIPATWLSGCLLVDTGMPGGHPSTTMAGPALVPVITARLGGARNASTGARELKLEEERELACALWNALEQPPDLYGEWSTDQLFILAMPKSTLQVLVKLMKSNDDDAVLASVHVLDLYLRRVGGTSMESLQSFQEFMRTLEEEDAVHVLEAICDSHIEDAADIAADLIDDFFAELCEDGDGDEGEDQWSTGIDLSYPTENAFANIGGDDGAGGGAGGGDAFGGFTRNAHEPEVPKNGVGRGRGRLATIPSWMSK